MAVQDEREMAQILTEFLTRKPAYSGSAPIEGFIQTEIQAIARKIAGEVVNKNPELRNVIRSRAEEVVRRALNEDSYLNNMITNTIAKVISDRALEVEE